MDTLDVSSSQSNRKQFAFIRRPVVGHEDHIIDTLGRVFRLAPHGMRLLTQHETPDGYRQVCFGKPPVGYVHRLMWETFKGPIPAGLVVMHKDDNPSNNKLWNLELGTHLDNVQDKIKKGRSIHSGIKLDIKIATEIRGLYQSGGYTQAELAKLYSICLKQMGKLLRNESWVQK